MQINLTFEEAHWVRYAIILAANQSANTATAQKRIYLEVLDRLGRAEQEELLAQEPSRAQDELFRFPFVNPDDSNKPSPGDPLQ